MTGDRVISDSVKNNTSHTAIYATTITNQVHVSQVSYSSVQVNNNMVQPTSAHIKNVGHKVSPPNTRQVNTNSTSQTAPPKNVGHKSRPRSRESGPVTVVSESTNQTGHHNIGKYPVQVSTVNPNMSSGQVPAQHRASPDQRCKAVTTSCQSNHFMYEPFSVTELMSLVAGGLSTKSVQDQKGASARYKSMRATLVSVLSVLVREMGVYTVAVPDAIHASVESLRESLVGADSDYASMDQLYDLLVRLTPWSIPVYGALPCVRSEGDGGFQKAECVSVAVAGFEYLVWLSGLSVVHHLATRECEGVQEMGEHNRHVIPAMHWPCNAGQTNNVTEGKFYIPQHPKRGCCVKTRERLNGIILRSINGAPQTVPRAAAC
ncbi:hypothetical protein FIBSPDRAFT_892997 [Athelia psychrophila]|uniref:Uncharacterized protein n=1 Tax=Athelia psychrophila TaxID=1759441 RepID=A0A166HL42_9AGAM|nr:hypothetical protein FIBSPDRAFT_892997 [Fibularhizoctonia sp. CBS 109695]